MSIRFDQTGWEQLQPGAYRNSDGDIAELHVFDIPPNLAASLEDLDALWRDTVAQPPQAKARSNSTDLPAFHAAPPWRG